MLHMRILLIRGALLETIPEAEQVRFLRAGFVTRAGADPESDFLAVPLDSHSLIFLRFHKLLSGRQ